MDDVLRNIPDNFEPLGDVQFTGDATSVGKQFAASLQGVDLAIANSGIKAQDPENMGSPSGGDPSPDARFGALVRRKASMLAVLRRATADIDDHVVEAWAWQRMSKSHLDAQGFGEWRPATASETRFKMGVALSPQRLREMKRQVDKAIDRELSKSGWRL